MRYFPALLGGAASVALVAMATQARGQLPAPDIEAAAAAQFDRGLAAMNEGNLDVGCPALAESVRLDPRAGAIFTLAECEARWGRVASASAHYDDYLARYARMPGDQQKMQSERAAIATHMRAELKPKIPQLAIRLPPGAPNDLIVKRDGVVLGAPSLGIPLPIDPGTHELVVETPDGASTSRTIELSPAAHEDVTLDVPALGQPPPPPGEPRQESTPYLAYGALGLGVVGLGVGTVFGISALSKTSTIDAHCAGNACDHEGKQAADAAQSAALVSNVAFGVAAVALVTGTVLWLVAPRRQASTTTPHGLTKVGQALGPSIRPGFGVLGTAPALFAEGSY